MPSHIIFLCNLNFIIIQIHTHASSIMRYIYILYIYIYNIYETIIILIVPVYQIWDFSLLTILRYFCPSFFYCWINRSVSAKNRCLGVDSVNLDKSVIDAKTGARRNFNRACTDLGNNGLNKLTTVFWCWCCLLMLWLMEYEFS